MELRVSIALALAVLASACAATPRVTPAPVAQREPEPEVQVAAEPEPEPEPAPAPAPRERTVAIGGSGDILIHIKVARSATEFADAGGYAHVFGELRGVLTEGEIAFANLETPLSMRVPPETGDPPILGAPADVATGLAGAGIDVLSTANNHAYDQTALGMVDTLAAIAAAQIAQVGASEQLERTPGPIVIERDGVRVAIVAFTERINRGPAVRDQPVFISRFEEERALRVLTEARSTADVVVVSIHWSHDYVREPMHTQRRLARWLVDSGADLILGHGPHVLQEVERFESPRGDAVCAYSLGNLVSNQGLQYAAGRRIPEGVHPAAVLPETRDGAWLRARFALEDGRIVLRGLEAVPLWTHNNHLARARGDEDRLDIRVRPLSAIEPVLREERRAAIAAALGEHVTLLSD
jgi:poly-gamma-glutamate capsule biosynthesis protein CapA/YwtB (metallophosphatase superfamily)